MRMLRLTLERRVWFLLSLSALVFSWIVPVDTKRLRGKRRRKHARNKGPTFRITVFHSILQQEDGTIQSEPETKAIPIVNGDETEAIYSIQLPEAIRTEHQDLIENGQLIISVDAATIENETVQYRSDAAVQVVKKSISSDSLNKVIPKSLGSNTEHPKLGILRVAMSKGPHDRRQVGYSASQIRQHLFEHEVSLKNQLRRCSHGTVLVQNAGIFDVVVSGMTSDYPNAGAIRNKALELLAQQQGVSSAKALADYVLVIIPPNTFKGFVGNAGVNHWIMTVNDLWSLDVIVYMHEIMHNMGLNHAFLSDNTPDFSSYMSLTGNRPNLYGPLKCYNAASNREMGWFAHRTEYVNLYKNPAQQIRLAAFSEAYGYGRTNNKDPLLIAIGEYTLQYNLATEFNIGTEQLQNQVTVARSAIGKTIVEKDGLEPSGKTFMIRNFGGTGKTLQVEACKKIPGEGTSPTVMMVGISLGQPESPCVSAAATVVTPPNPPRTPQNEVTTSPNNICPDTSLTLVTFQKGSDRSAVHCNWLDQHKKLLAYCFRNSLDGPIFQTVADVCQQECATRTGACIRLRQQRQQPTTVATTTTTTSTSTSTSTTTTTTTTTSATATATTTRATRGSKPVCPDTSNQQVEISRGRFIRCAWIGAQGSDSVRDYCRLRNVYGHKVMQTVGHICLRECASVTRACLALP